MRADFLCKVYEGIDPGYHMNKQHWITVIPDSDVPLDELYDILRESYERTRTHPRRTKEEEGEAT